MEMEKKRSDVEEAFSRLVSIMERLRAPDGCPWDREQDFSTLRRYIVEEAYELVEAIEGNDERAIMEESGISSSRLSSFPKLPRSRDSFQSVTF